MCPAVSAPSPRLAVCMHCTAIPPCRSTSTPRVCHPHRPPPSVLRGLSHTSPRLAVSTPSSLDTCTAVTGVTNMDSGNAEGDLFFYAGDDLNNPYNCRRNPTASKCANGTGWVTHPPPPDSLTHQCATRMVVCGRLGGWGDSLSGHSTTHAWSSHEPIRTVRTVSQRGDGVDGVDAGRVLEWADFGCVCCRHAHPRPKRARTLTRVHDDPPGMSSSTNKCIGSSRYGWTRAWWGRTLRATHPKTGPGDRSPVNFATPTAAARTGFGPLAKLPQPGCLGLRQLGRTSKQRARCARGPRLGRYLPRSKANAGRLR